MIVTCRRLSFALRSSSLLALALFSFAVATRTASAAPLVYGNFPAATVDYLAVQEESLTDPGLFPFGPPTIGGDTMDFNPSGFAANATSAGNSDNTDSHLSFDIKAHAGIGINNVKFTEAGDTTLSGLLGQAQTTVGAVIFVEITEVSIANVLTPVSLNAPVGPMTFTPQSSFLLTVDGAGSKSWTGTVTVNLLPTLAANNINGFVTKVHVTLDNTLTAASVPGTAAFIQKKDADGLVVTVNIPEPASCATALIGLGLAASLFRRRK